MRDTVLPLAVGLSFLLAGCASLPEPKHANPGLPATWPDATAETPVAEDWWQAYGDPVLNALIEEALAHNRDIRQAAARVEEARAALGLAESARKPRVEAAAGAGRSKMSERGSMPMPEGTPVINDSWTLDLRAAYEVDLWGRYRAASEAARAELLASAYAREVVRASLVAAIARGHFRLAALATERELVTTTLENRRAALAMQRLRLEGGIASELETYQAEAELAGIEIDLAALDQASRRQETALAILIGREPRAMIEQRIAPGTRLDALPVPPAVPAGLPADLLLRRPDLRQAEQTLLTRQARIREARAALYPNLSLTANLGSESQSLGDLLSKPAMIWGLSAGLAQTIFNGGRTEAAIQAASARQEQALADYEKAIRVAFGEVLDALIDHRQARETGAAEARRAEALRQATALAELRHQHGASGYLEVLDAQRNLFQAERNRIHARHAQLAASVDLFKALGGGWNASAVSGH